MSGPQFLLDTNIVIGVARGPGPARDLLDLSDAPPDVCALSQISRIEMLGFGGLDGAEEARLLTILASMTVFLIDDAVEREAIALRRRTRLKLPDAIIAATARVHGLEVLTLDERFRATLVAI